MFGAFDAWKILPGFTCKITYCAIFNFLQFYFSFFIFFRMHNNLNDAITTFTVCFISRWSSPRILCKSSFTHKRSSDFNCHIRVYGRYVWPFISFYFFLIGDEILNSKILSSRKQKQMANQDVVYWTMSVSYTHLTLPTIYSV